MTSGDLGKSQEGRQDARIAYVHSDALRKVADQLPANIGRSSLVHSLISAYGLLGTTGDGLSPDRQEASSTAAVIAPESAGKADLLRYHDAAYVGKSICA